MTVRISGLRTPSTMVAQLFPMYGVPVSQALEMQVVLLHEVLRERGILVEVAESTIIIFISHTWLSHTHPDPNMQQMRMLQRILRRLRTSREAIHSGWLDRLVYGDKHVPAETCRQHFAAAHLWLDYWSVPQAVWEPAAVKAQQDAIQSIPAYVARSDYFVVLVPPSLHVDRKEVWGYQEWSMRAWCRLEMLSHVFTKHHSAVIIAESESQMQLANSAEWFYNVPGKGSLSCCALGHQIVKDGRIIPLQCDRHKILAVTEQMFAAKLDKYLARGDLQNYRLLLSLSSCLLEGLPARQAAPPATLEDFLIKYRFSSAFEQEGRSGSGWSPLRIAAYECNLPVMQALLKARANVECPTKKPEPDMWHLKGFTILHGACKVHGNPEVLGMLLAHGAKLYALSTPERSQPAEQCSHSPRALQFLIEKGLDISRVTNIFGVDHIHLAGLLRCSATVELMLKEGLQPRYAGNGTCHMHSAVLGGDIAVLRELCARPAEVAAAKSPQPMYGIPKLLWQVFGLASRFSEDPFYAFLSEWSLSTPLHVAAAEGRLNAAKLLMEHGFTMDARNHRGRTPLHLACRFGHEHVVRFFSEQPGFAEASTIRCSHAGKTALELARGSGELAALLPEGGPSSTGGRLLCCRHRRHSRPPPQECELVEVSV